MHKPLRAILLESSDAHCAQRYETDSDDPHLKTIWLLGADRNHNARVYDEGTMVYRNGRWSFLRDPIGD